MIPSSTWQVPHVSSVFTPVNQQAMSSILELLQCYLTVAEAAATLPQPAQHGARACQTLPTVPSLPHVLMKKYGEQLTLRVRRTGTACAGPGRRRGFVHFFQVFETAMLAPKKQRKVLLFFQLRLIILDSGRRMVYRCHGNVEIQ